MTFEQFLNLRLPDLVRLAVLLCGNRPTGEQLVDAAVLRADGLTTSVDDPEDVFAQLRAWVVRGYLSEGMQLGRGPASDLDSPVVDGSQADADWDDLTARFVTSSKLQRTVTVLRYAEDLDVANIAAAMGSSVDGISLYLQRVLLELNVGTPDGSGSTATEVNTEDDVRDLLALYGDDVDPDVSDQLASILRALPELSDAVAAREEEQARAAQAGAERREAERLEAERTEAERVEAERLEVERLAAERAEAERLETERLEAERLEGERLEAERLETERLEAERLEAERLEAERLEVERLAAERAEAERLEAARVEAERVEAERLAAEQADAERLEAERVEAERLEAARAEAERLEAERLEAERAEAERLAAERLEVERVEAERAETKRAEAERVEAERVAAERAEAARVEAERVEAERLAAERAENARLEAERLEAERLAAERLEVERVEAERAEAERAEAERAEAERVEAERLEAERAEAARVEAERLEAARAEAERLEAERLEAERLEAERLEAERLEAERAETARVEAERLDAQRLGREGRDVGPPSADEPTGQRSGRRERAEAKRRERELKAAARAAKIAARESERERLRRERAERAAAERAARADQMPDEPAAEASTPSVVEPPRASPSSTELERSDTQRSDTEQVEAAAPFEPSSATPSDTSAPVDAAIERSEARRLDRERKAAARAAKGAAKQVEQDRLRRETETRAEASRRARAAELAAWAERTKAAEAAERELLEGQAGRPDAKFDTDTDAEFDTEADESDVVFTDIVTTPDTDPARTDPEGGPVAESGPRLDTTADAASNIGTAPAAASRTGLDVAGRDDVDTSTPAASGRRPGGTAQDTRAASSFKPSDAVRGVPATDSSGTAAESDTDAALRRARGRRLLTAGLIAALIVLTIGIVTVAGRDSGTSNAQSSGSDTGSGLPSPVVRPLPGTRVLAEYTGKGSKTVRAGALSVGPGRQLALNVVCKGEGTLTAGPVVLGSCAVPVATDAKDLSTSALRIVAPDTMSWRIAFTDQPDSGTNGALANPPDPVLSSPDAADVVASKTGSGNATIKVTRGDGASRSPIRIALTCEGSGVTLRSDVKAIDGKYAHTCFSGWSFDFDTDAVSLPTSFKVEAASGTSWNVVVVRL